MTQLSYESFPGELRATVPGFEHVYDEHVTDHDEVLPHVLLGDLVRFLSNEVAAHGHNSAPLKQAMILLERALESGDARLEELVVVSFLENLDMDDPHFPVIRRSFGPRLEELHERFAKAGLNEV